MIHIEIVESPFEAEPVWWCVSCDCGWSEDVGWQSDAEDLGRWHVREADCDW